jgi:hypothetical protein
MVERNANEASNFLFMILERLMFGGGGGGPAAIAGLAWIAGVLARF